MPRLEFTAKTKKAARERAGGLCEASGPFYNRAFDSRCSKPLDRVEYDHFIRAADGGDASLENCRAVCLECHAWKTRHVDTPGAAKAKRVRKKHGLDPVTRRPRPPINSRGFAPGSKPIPSRPMRMKP